MQKQLLTTIDISAVHNLGIKRLTDDSTNLLGLGPKTHPVVRDLLVKKSFFDLDHQNIWCPGKTLGCPCLQRCPRSIHPDYNRYV